MGIINLSDYQQANILERKSVQNIGQVEFVHMDCDVSSDIAIYKVKQPVYWWQCRLFRIKFARSKVQD